ncbi:CPBP family intramembrane glutamic endopeptidase [Rhabdothermincola salaria]|uniref:CPBP family intramembrane glutamic endopeptidase n=1 Tax=Rhabdothermincola salaria TaxID=2903142 RepID=UPI001E57ACEB|nr:type II CAAX endopeptidase family protein [Rhabdothermincola salaria]MCD9623254.1 CPBP family intramembrane metalloprotease [Rhabdothermincola salaria]
MGDVIYGLVLWLAGGVVAAIAIVASGAIDLDTGEVGELSLGAIAFTLVAGWVGFVGWPMVATYRKGQRSLARDFGLQVRWIDVGWGLLGGLGALAVSVAGGLLWTIISGDESPTNADFLPSSPGLLGALALWFLVGVATPVAEELFFRGLMLRAVGRRWGLPAGVALSSIVFGFFHANALSFSGLFIVAVTASYGAVFALLVVRAEGRLGPAIVAHAVVNSVAVVAMFATS